MRHWIDWVFTGNADDAGALYKLFWSAVILLLILAGACAIAVASVFALDGRWTP